MQTLLAVSMRSGSVRFSGITALTIAIVTFAETTRPAHGAPENDTELLRSVAFAARNNCQRVVTWQGAAEYRVEDHNVRDAPADRTSEVMNAGRVAFWFDSAPNALLSKWEDVDRRPTRGTEKILEFANVLSVKDGFHRYRGDLGVVRPNAMVVWAPDSKEAKRSTGGDFDPRWVLNKIQPGGTKDVSDELLMVHSQLETGEWKGLGDKAPVKVERKDDVVTVTIQYGDTATEQYVCDLSQGGMPLRIERDNPQQTEVTQYTYRQVDGVWIPQEMRFRGITKGQDDPGRTFVKTVTFGNTVLNKPIDPAIFTWEGMGLKRNDVVTDRRVPGFPHRYEYGVGTTGRDLEELTRTLIEKPTVTTTRASEEPGVPRPTMSDALGSAPKQIRPGEDNTGRHRGDKWGAWSYLLPLSGVVVIVGCALVIQRRKRTSGQRL